MDSLLGVECMGRRNFEQGGNSGRGRWRKAEGVKLVAMHGWRDIPLEAWRVVEAVLADQNAIVHLKSTWKGTDESIGNEAEPALVL